MNGLCVFFKCSWEVINQDQMCNVTLITVLVTQVEYT